MNYRVSKGGLGKAKVTYPCPGCGDELTSPIEDAGNKDKCPTCAADLVVPGEVELMRLHADVERAREQDEARKRDAAQRKAEQAAAAATKPIDYQSPPSAQDREDARRQRDAANAIARAQRPDTYHAILKGAKVLSFFALICTIIGWLLLTLAAAFIVGGIVTKEWALLLPTASCLGGAILYLVIGAIINMLASLSTAIRDIAIQTHHTTLAHAIREPLEVNIVNPTTAAPTPAPTPA